MTYNWNELLVRLKLFSASSFTEIVQHMQGSMAWTLAIENYLAALVNFIDWYNTGINKKSSLNYPPLYANYVSTVHSAPLKMASYIHPNVKLKDTTWILIVFCRCCWVTFWECPVTHYIFMSHVPSHICYSLAHTWKSQIYLRQILQNALLATIGQ